MADGNPIIAAADQAAARTGGSPLEGAGLAQDAHDLTGQVLSGSWAEGLISAASLANEVKDFVQDPIAKLASIGLGWAMEFFSPLQQFLDWLTGDQEQLERLSLSWEGIAAELGGTAQELDGLYRKDTAPWSGPAVTQYKQFCADRVELYAAAAGAASATGGLIKLCGVILNVVRSVVRQLITDCVGKVISIVLRYPPPATPAAAPEIVSQVADTGGLISKWMRSLQRAFANAWDLLKQSGNLFRDVKKYLAYSKKMAGELADGGALYAKLALGAFADVPAAAKAAAKNAVRDIPGELPAKIGFEAAKEGAKYVTGTEAEQEQPATLYDGPGPHRVTGTL